MPPRSVIISRVAASLVLGGLAAVVSVGTEFQYVLVYLPDASYLLRELAIAAVCAVIAAQTENRYDTRRAVIVTAILAYLGARALHGGFLEPGSLHSWFPTALKFPELCPISGDSTL